MHTLWCRLAKCASKDPGRWAPHVCRNRNQWITLDIKLFFFWKTVTVCVFCVYSANRNLQLNVCCFLVQVERWDRYELAEALFSASSHSLRYEVLLQIWHKGFMFWWIDCFAILLFVVILVWACSVKVIANSFTKLDLSLDPIDNLGGGQRVWGACGVGFNLFSRLAPRLELNFAYMCRF